MKRLSLLLATAIAVPSLVFAAQPSTPGAKLISNLTKGQVTAVKEFSAPLGLQGYVVQAPNGQQTIMFTDKSGQYLIAGNIITASGQNLTEEYASKYINAHMAANAYQQIGETHWITDGKNSATHKLYVVWDPNCAYCHLLFKALRPMIDAGDVQVRWIPVAIRPHSEGKTARILNAGSDSAAVALMKQDEQAFDMQTEQGGIQPLASDASGATKAFSETKTNTGFFIKNHFIGTPVILYKNAQGEPTMVPGYVGGARLKTLVDGASASW